MRLFFAIRLSEVVRVKLMMIQEELKPFVSKGHFTLKDNLHLTLVFLGETDASSLGNLHQILLSLSMEPFEIVLDHSGYFDKREGKVVWLGIKQEPRLLLIHQQLSNGLNNKGFRFETKPFSPHVTLGRGIQTLSDASKLRPDIKPIHVPVSRISLMVSERVDGLLHYREIDAIDL